ncbi:MAG: branched-chain amino acid ABC transporter permease [Actinomycetia bacterium]|nr:branched-chain amino acid ABC transporter permease [Actinomycetes bacterium]
MQLFLQRVFDGLANGAIYASLAVALSMVYRGSGVLNLAQGELAMIGAHIAALLTSPAIPGLFGSGVAAALGAPLPVAVAIALAALLTAPLGMVIERFVIRPIDSSDLVQVVGVTLALFLLLNALAGELWGFRLRIPSPFPSGPHDRILIADARLRWETIGVVTTMIGLVVILGLIQRHTKLGLAFRAVSSSPESSQLVGIRVGRVLSAAWGIAAALGAVAGGLVGGAIGVAPDMMIRILILALAAAVVGGLTRPGAALLAGLGLGVGEALFIGYFDFMSSQLAVVWALAVMVLILLFRPQGLAPAAGIGVRK